MSLVDDRGQKIGEYKGRTIVMEKGIPILIYHNFEVENSKLKEYDVDKNEYTEVKFPEIFIPISQVGGKISADKIDGIRLENVELIEQEEDLGLGDFEDLEKQIKKIKECIEYSKK